MCRDTEHDQSPGPVISIWGSCVSRDTLEFMHNVELGAYVARQSAIVALSPATDLDVPLDALVSPFQRRMMRGDTQADAASRMGVSNESLILIDLVDERRGVWQFPDGTFLTNSVEAFRTGIEEWAPDAGARLIEFGTDEHYSLWKQGFTIVTRRLAASGRPLVLLDIAWASVFEGQVTRYGVVGQVRRAGRRSQRGIAHFVRTVRRDRSIISGATKMSDRPASQGDEYVRVARDANAKYRRYIEEATRHVSVTVSRSREDVRMNRAHRWGIGHYHYADSDYLAISSEIAALLRLQ